MPKVKMAPPIGQLELILTPEQIALLREGYAADPAWLANYPADVYHDLYPGGSKAFDSFVNSVFVHGDPAKPPTTRMIGKDRERVVIALLASQPNAEFLAIHLYWGLVEGLSVNEISQIILVVGGYNGYSFYTNGLSVFAKTLTALKSSCDDGQPVTPEQALAAIQTAFV